MKLKNPNQITINEFPAYFDELVDFIVKNRTAFISDEDIDGLREAQTDLKNALRLAKTLVSELHNVVNQTKIINS